MRCSQPQGAQCKLSMEQELRWPQGLTRAGFGRVPSQSERNITHRRAHRRSCSYLKGRMLCATIHRAMLAEAN